MSCAMSSRLIQVVTGHLTKLKIKFHVAMTIVIKDIKK